MTQNCSKQRYKKIGCLGLIGLFLFCLAPGLDAEEKIQKEMVIKVKPRIIALPGNQVAKVPISAARVRSTELRELNEKYNAISIERLFKIGEKIEKEKPLTIKGIKGAAPREEEPAEETVDLSRILTKEKRKELLAKKEDVVEINDTFLIQFDVDTRIDMNRVAFEYKSLDVVTFADYVVRKE